MWYQQSTVETDNLLNNELLSTFLFRQCLTVSGAVVALQRLWRRPKMFQLTYLLTYLILTCKQSCIKYSTNKYQCQYQYQWSKYQYKYQYPTFKYQYQYQYITFKYQYQYKYCA